MKKNFLAAFLLINSLGFIFNQGIGIGEINDELKLYMGSPQTISVNNPTRIALGNPAVADVVQVSKKTMTIAPKGPGKTTLVFWDNFGEQSYIIRVYSEDTKDVKRRIDNAIAKLKLKDVYTKEEDEEGKVFLLGTVKFAQDKEKLSIAMGPLKEKTVDLISVKEDETVIEIDVQVLELQKGVSNKLGFTWPGSLNITEIAAGGAAPGITASGATWGKLFKLGNMTRDAYTLTLDALIQEGKARVLSRPRLSCQSGKEAKLLVGGEVPVLSSTVTGGGTAGTTGTPGSVEYKEYGIKLNIKPKVDDRRRIHLNVNVEVSEVGTAVTTSYALAYPFIKRTASTELFLDDGQTMGIGGLIKQKSEEELRKFPWLADVPILGMFFRARTTTEGDGFSTRGDSELFITLTPRIVSETLDGQEPGKEEPKIKPVPLVNEETLDPVTKYTQIVQKRITDNLKYPPQAKGAGFQGTVRLALRLSFKGDLLEAGIREKSGYRILDENALRTARKITSYPPFPATIDSQELWIEVPIVYKLD